MTQQQPDPRQQQRRNIRVTAILATVVVGMVALSFAAVPLYDLFCRVTGFQGTVSRSDSSAQKVLDRKVTVRFEAREDSQLPLEFEAVTEKQTVKVGANGLAYFKATNPTDHPVTTRAVYNVTPIKVGEYFKKVQCFCFNKQTVAAGETVDMPVTYFLDPKMAKEQRLNDIRKVTLSYIMYPAGKPPKQKDSEAWKEPQAAAAGQVN